jgi:hypothetical protein
MTKKIISILALAFAIATPALNINTQAQTQARYTFTQRIVTATSGLNIRDKNCNVLQVVGYGTLIDEASKETISCNVRGKSVKMINVNRFLSTGEGYVAESFASIVNDKPLSGTIQDTTFIVNASSGLNLRDENCKRVTTVKNGTALKQVLSTDYFRVCNAKGEYYMMTRISYNNKEYFVATSFLK